MELNQLVIRQAQLTDAFAIAQAEIEIAKEPGLLVSRFNELQAERFRNSIAQSLKDDRWCYLVAEHQGTLVGHVILEPLHLASIAHVASLTLVIHSNWQNLGIGQKLLHTAIEWAKKSDAIEKIELNVRASNQRARSLYKKMGFSEEGRLVNRIKISPEQYIDDILMALFVS